MLAISFVFDHKAYALEKNILLQNVLLTQIMAQAEKLWIWFLALYKHLGTWDILSTTPFPQNNNNNNNIFLAILVAILVYCYCQNKLL